MSDESDKAPEPPHKRRWYQYSSRPDGVKIRDQWWSETLYLLVIMAFTIPGVKFAIEDGEITFYLIVCVFGLIYQSSRIVKAFYRRKLLFDRQKRIRIIQSARPTQSRPFQFPTSDIIYLTICLTLCAIFMAFFVMAIMF